MQRVESERSSLQEGSFFFSFFTLFFAKRVQWNSRGSYLTGFPSRRVEFWKSRNLWKNLAAVLFRKWPPASSFENFCETRVSAGRRNNFCHQFFYRVAQASVIPYKLTWLLKRTRRNISSCFKSFNWGWRVNSSIKTLDERRNVEVPIFFFFFFFRKLNLLNTHDCLNLINTSLSFHVNLHNLLNAYDEIFCRSMCCF